VLNRFVLNNDITHIVNCFGFTGKPNVDECELRKEECWHLNVTLPLKISQLCKQLSVKYIHISSGCVYSGYDKEFTESDIPNFGLFSESSFYSKSKHAYETMDPYGCIVRIRMPFCNEFVDRSYLSKILKYDNLIDFRNSKTYIPDLCRFIQYFIDQNHRWNGIVNFVNPEALTTTEVIGILAKSGKTNPNWKFVDTKELNLLAPRSNCVLSTKKFESLFPDFKLTTEKEAIAKALSYTKI